MTAYHLCVVIIVDQTLHDVTGSDFSHIICDCTPVTNINIDKQ